jgi:hypothetical protein
LIITSLDDPFRREGEDGAPLSRDEHAAADLSFSPKLAVEALRWLGHMAVWS